MLSDFFLVRSFLKWKNTYMMKMEEWMHIISEMDAMVSMADFRYNHPEAEEAEFVSGSPEADTESDVSEMQESEVRKSCSRGRISIILSWVPRR